MNTKVITVARTIGASGEEIARAVAQRLDFRYVDYQIIQDAAQEAGASPEAVSEAQHTPSLLTRLLETLARNPSMPEAVWANPTPLAESPMYTSADYRRFVEEVIVDIADRGGAVIVGHGSQAVLRGRTDTLRTLVTASMDYRVRRIMKGMAVDETQAAKMAKRSDHDRIIYMDRFYNTGWLAPDTYDLCISTDHVNVEQATELMIKAAELR
ncbi:MAG: cytidylate kinase-like family protein [Dehalococcoidia bacterium]|nr:cytidylate kinase-like family protein [Dehalococcoidia bacterium]